MALCRNVLQEDDTLCELYVDTRSDVSDYSDNESLDIDSDVPTTSSQTIVIFYWSTEPMISIPIFPHIYQDNFYNSEIAQTLLDRNVRVCGTMRGSARDLEGEGKRLKKEKSAFWRNGDIMVQVWKDKTCANDK